MFEEFDDFSAAFKREKQLKNWHKDWKWNLAKISNPVSKDLNKSISISRRDAEINSA